jgi:hypothetical protein
LAKKNEKSTEPIKHLNIAEFNRGQSSKADKEHIRSGRGGAHPEKREANSRLNLICLLPAIIREGN